MKLTAVIDFETTGISPACGDRATEVAIVLLDGGRAVDRFQSLMNAGVRIPAFITQLTGITNAMVAAAPAAAQVMLDASRFIGAAPLVAHNAAFDRRFWQAELAHAGLSAPQPFICTLLLSRRLYPQAPNHRLGSLVDYHQLPRAGQAHRALADAEMACELLGQIRRDLGRRFGVAATTHELLLSLQACSRKTVPAHIQRYLARTCPVADAGPDTARAGLPTAEKIDLLLNI